MLSFKTHAVLEVLGAGVVAAAPWFTGSRRNGPNYWLPHAAAFGIEAVFALCTKYPEDAKR